MAIKNPYLNRISGSGGSKKFVESAFTVFYNKDEEAQNQQNGADNFYTIYVEMLQTDTPDNEKVGHTDLRYEWAEGQAKPRRGIRVNKEQLAQILEKTDNHQPRLDKEGNIVGIMATGSHQIGFGRRASFKDRDGVERDHIRMFPVIETMRPVGREIPDLQTKLWADRQIGYANEKVQNEATKTDPLKKAMETLINKEAAQSQIETDQIENNEPVVDEGPDFD